jgi:hypothetical protein
MTRYGVYKRHNTGGTLGYVVKRENVESDITLVEFKVNDVYPEAEQKQRAHFYCQYLNTVEVARDAAAANANAQWVVKVSLEPLKK